MSHVCSEKSELYLAFFHCEDSATAVKHKGDLCSGHERVDVEFAVVNSVLGSAVDRKIHSMLGICLS